MNYIGGIVRRTGTKIAIGDRISSLEEIFHGENPIKIRYERKKKIMVEKKIPAGIGY